MKNYYKLEKFSLFFNYYAYVDVEEYLADNLFEQEKVRVYFGKEYEKKNCPYKIIFCKVKRNMEEQFIRAMSRLENKMLLLGYKDYLEFCSKLQAELVCAEEGNRC